MECWAGNGRFARRRAGVRSRVSQHSNTPLLQHSLSSLVEPFLDVPVRVERHALASVRPTHVADADEIGCRQAIEHADLGAQQRGLAAETHWADAELVGGLDDVLFQLAKLRIWIGVVEPAQELLLRILVAGGAVA